MNALSARSHLAARGPRLCLGRREGRRALKCCAQALYKGAATWPRRPLPPPDQDAAAGIGGADQSAPGNSSDAAAPAARMTVALPVSIEGVHGAKRKTSHASHVVQEEGDVDYG